MNKRVLATGLGALLLAITSVIGLWGWRSANKRIQELEAEQEILQGQEKRSAVLRSVSSQLEEIAHQQKEISDEQREEALQQTRVANEMRERSEMERQNAISAQHAALASERMALDAYEMAENQREIAEHQRVQAELSKRVADTLSYIALGRSLGSLALTQYRTGNSEIADLLSYASYLYTDRYDGDMYNPAVYQALTKASQSQKEWHEQTGAVANISFMPKSDNQLVSVGTYGEVLFHEKKGNHLKTTVLIKDKNYDFRDVWVDAATKNIYAVSRSGHLFIHTSKGNQILTLDGMTHPMKVEGYKNSKFLLVIGEDCVKELDTQTNLITKTRKLNYKVTLVSRYNNMPALFDDNGNMYFFETIDKVTYRKVPVSGRITAFASSKGSGLEAYGMSEGTIFLFDKAGNMRRLIGHRSRISKIKINNIRLYSASFDGTVNLWVAKGEKIEPMTLMNANSWIMHFTFDESKNHMWTGDQKGNVSEMLISIPTIIKNVKEKLKRDFTPAEWNYYIGPNIPFESFAVNNGQRKEGRR